MLAVTLPKAVTPETDNQPDQPGLDSKLSQALQKQIELRAAELLEIHPQFRGRSQLINVRCVGRRLVLSGCLPSYYLKQLAQEAVRGLGQFEIENNIRVFGLPGHLKLATRQNESQIQRRKFDCFKGEKINEQSC